MKILVATKQKEFTKDIIGFDVETVGRKNEFYMCSFWNEKFQEVFFSKEEAISFIKRMLYDKRNNFIITATNLQFDFFALFGHDMSFNLMFRGADLIYATSYLDGNEFRRNPKNKQRKLIMIDTLNYAKMSVEKCGKLLDIPKFQKPRCLGRLPISEDEKDELVSYNLRDSEISARILRFFYRSFEELGATPKNTIASTALSLFKNKYLHNTYFRHTIPQLVEQFKAYYGGNTQAYARGSISREGNEDGTGKGHYKYYDVNSLYPYCMLNELPDPNTMKVCSSNNLKNIELFDGVSDVEVSCPFMDYPLLPLRIDQKLIFPIGRFRSWYSHVELRKALDLGYEIHKVHKTYYFTKSCSPFRKYVEDLYSLRKRYKKEGSNMEYVVKILMNSLYGKFGQKFTDRDEWIPMDLTKEQLDELDEFEIVGNYIRIKKRMTEPSAFCFPIWSLHITAYARMHLHKLICESDAVYCDTDSVITKKEMETSDKLGDLKLEMNIDKGVIVKPKYYFSVGDEYEFNKIKGIGMRVTNELFMRSLDDDFSFRYDKFCKFKESVRRGFHPNEIISISKKLDLEDTKRRWNGYFSRWTFQGSDPLVVNYETRDNRVVEENPEHGCGEEAKSSGSYASKDAGQILCETRR